MLHNALMSKCHTPFLSYMFTQKLMWSLLSCIINLINTLIRYNYQDSYDIAKFQNEEN